MVRRRATFAVLSILLVVSVGCNEDPQRTPFNFDTGKRDAGQSDIEASDTGSQDAGDVSDAREWFETACETTSPRDVRIEENERGNWAFAVPQRVSEYQTLRPAGFETPHAASVMNAREVGVAGALVSRPLEISESNSVDAILEQTLKDSLPEGLAEGEHSTFSGSYETRDGRSASQARIWVEAVKPMDAGEVRERILFHLAEFSPADVDINSDFEGEEGSEFRLLVTLQSMPTSGSNREHGVFSFSVAPKTSYNNSEPTRQTSEDIHLSNNLAPAGTSYTDFCEKFHVTIRDRMYVYLVIDVDGPEEYSKTVDRFFSKIADQAFEPTPRLVRLGVTNTVMANEGRFVHDGWLNDKDEFLQAIKDAATDCKTTDDWACEGERDGLAVAKSGFEYMNDQENPPPRDVRMVPGGVSAVGIISDEKPHTIESGERTADYYRAWGKRRVRQIIGPRGDCAADKKLAEAYIDVFGETDYPYLDDYCELQEELNYSNTVFQNFLTTFPISRRTTHAPQLSSTPLTPSLRSLLNAKEIPRSRENGFDYHPSDNTAWLNGSYSDIELDPFAGPYFVAFRYWSWDYDSGE